MHIHTMMADNCSGLNRFSCFHFAIVLFAVVLSWCMFRECGCGSGFSGCEVCGCCRSCAKKEKEGRQIDRKSGVKSEYCSVYSEHWIEAMSWYTVELGWFSLECHRN